MMFLTLAAIAAVPTVAITDLQNQTGSPDYDALGPGVASILLTRFQNAGVVQVVERRSLGAVLLEQQLTLDRLTDPTTAARTGRLIGADYIVTGELVTAAMPNLAIQLRVVEAETSRVVVAEDVRGNIGASGERFFELVDALSQDILTSMDVSLESQRRLGEIEQRELRAAMRFGEDLLRVNLDHPRSLFRESDKDFTANSTSWLVYDKRRRTVPMPEFSRRVGDQLTRERAYEERRVRKRKSKVQNWLAGSYGIAGTGVALGGLAAEEPPVALVGVGLIATSTVHTLVNIANQAKQRRDSRKVPTFYTAEQADRWIQHYNRYLDSE